VNVILAILTKGFLAKKFIFKRCIVAIFILGTHKLHKLVQHAAKISAIFL
jgi:hypothetical protein